MYTSSPARAAARTTRMARSEMALLEGVFQLGDQIIHVLDAHREPHQAVVDTETRAHVLGQRGVGHDRRMLDQALHAAEALREREQAAALKEAARRSEAASKHRGHHAAVALVHLLACQQMLWMRCKARVDNARDLGMLFEPRGDVHRVAAMALHAHGECLDAAQSEEGV